MDETAVAEAGVAELPTAFDASVVLLDVREDDEWARGHAAGAQHIPLGDVPARIGEIDTDATLYVVCARRRSIDAGIPVPRPQRV